MNSGIFFLCVAEQRFFSPEKGQIPQQNHKKRHKRETVRGGDVAQQIPERQSCFIFHYKFQARDEFCLSPLFHNLIVWLTKTVDNKL